MQRWRPNFVCGHSHAAIILLPADRFGRANQFRLEIDRPTRFPGDFVDRQDGALYRRQWEVALTGEPDMVMINTWNEWAEGTVIEPTVEFGYKYLELTLTYSLMLHRKLVVSRKPSEFDLTVKRCQVNADGESEIRLWATNQGVVVFTNLDAWIPLLTVTNASRTITTADESATNWQRRFYRAVQQ
jgi:hypothetical protein